MQPIRNHHRGSTAASSRSVVASSVSYHLPNQDRNGPTSKHFIFCTASLDHTCFSAGAERDQTNLDGSLPFRFYQAAKCPQNVNLLFCLGQTTIICLVTTCPDKRPIVLMPPPTPESDDGLRRMEHWLINHITATANVHDRLLACFNT